MTDIQPRIPSIGEDPRESMDEVAEAPGKVWFRSLDEAVIEADRCIQCGTCVAACPSDSIGIDSEENRPTLVRMCTGCSSCWDYCPRSGLRYERVAAETASADGLAEPEFYSARATNPIKNAGQDGGVVTALLVALLEAGEIDGALVAMEDEDEPLRGVPTLATTPDELRAAGGSIYNQVMSLGHLQKALDDADLTDPDIALVGTPCVIEGARALDLYKHDAASPISLTVALMCTRNFDHGRLTGALTARNVDPAQVDKLDISEGTLYAFDSDGETLLEADVDEFDAAGLRGCDECGDFVGKSADISAGSVGSPDGETTVVVRTEQGEKLWERAQTVESPQFDDNRPISMDSISEPEPLDSLASWNRRRAKHFLPREYDDKKSIGISLAEHRDTYEGTDREPEPFNPARVHQYEEWC